MIEDLKALLHKSLSLEKYSFLLPILFAFTQILGYKSKISYLKYFNIHSEFYHFNPFIDLVPLFSNFIIYSMTILIFILVILAFNRFFNICFDNIFKNINNKECSLIFKTKYIINNFKNISINMYKNIKCNYNMIDIIKEFINIYLALLILLFSICFLNNISFKGLVFTSAIIFIIAIIVSFFYALFNNLKSEKKEVKIAYNNYDYIFSYLSLAIFISFLLIFASSLGYSDAKNKTEFCIINNNKVILYNYDNYAIIAPYEYSKGGNSIIIDINNLKNINIENSEISCIVVKDFFRKGIDN